MSNLRQAAQQALVAMKSANHVNYSWACVEAVAVLEAALAEDALQRLTDVQQALEAHDPVDYRGWVLREVLFYNGEPVSHREPEQEPVAWMSPSKERLEFSTKSTVYGSHTIPLYTAPPQRKPLTINEVEQILAQHSYAVHGDRARYIVRMTEEAHGIKGEA